MANNTVSINKIVEQLYSHRDQTGDAVFVVESQQISAHRSVMAALSPKYKAQFYGLNPDQGEIRIPNVSAAAFNEFLQFFYKESVDLTMDNIETVLDLAQQSLVDEFVEICADFLKKSITSNNVCFVYRLAVLYDIETLRVDCERQISSKTMDVFGSDNFLRCNREVLLNILNLDTFSCSEANVFNACIEWARVHCKQNGWDEKTAENLRASLGYAVYMIRFSSMNAQEFAAALHGSLNNFFWADELVELFSIVSKVKDFKSRKFSQMTRTGPKDNLQAVAGSRSWSMECNRIISIIGDRADVDMNGISESTIRCDNPIRLYGLALGFHFNKSYLDSFHLYGNFFVYIARETNGPLVGINPACKFNELNNETIVMFDDPIEGITSIYLSKLQYNLQADHIKLVLKDQVDVDNNKFVCNGGLITRFFFDNL